jgi:cell division protein FtsI (penicillin-binding protein 3)
LVVIHKPNKRKGYYGATVAAPVFKKIAQKMYASVPVSEEIANEKPTIPELNLAHKKYYSLLNSEKKTVPNVKGMAGMDAVSVLENLGLKVVFQGVGKVKYQSLRRGQKIKKGNTIVLKLSS